jgi:hypothetical protein
MRVYLHPWKWPGARVAIVLALASVPMIGGCAGRRVDGHGHFQHLRPTASISYLGEMELREARLPAGVSALDAITRLRPQYFTSGINASVYVNGMAMSSVEDLRAIKAQDLLEIRYLRGAEADEVLGPALQRSSRVLLIRLKAAGTR